MVWYCIETFKYTYGRKKNIFDTNDAMMNENRHWSLEEKKKINSNCINLQSCVVTTEQDSVKYWQYVHSTEV